MIYKEKVLVGLCFILLLNLSHSLMCLAASERQGRLIVPILEPTDRLEMPQFDIDLEKGLREYYEEIKGIQVYAHLSRAVYEGVQRYDTWVRVRDNNIEAVDFDVPFLPLMDPIQSSILRNSLPGELTQNELKKENPIGFHVATYKDEESGRIIVSFQGTDPESIADWIANFGHMDHIPMQYHLANEYVKEEIEKYGADNIVLTGHSLGGGLAQYAAAKNNISAVTFNSAGLWAPTIQDANHGYIHKINNYVNVGKYSDVVNKTGVNLGKTIYIYGANSSYNPLDIHSMDTFVNYIDSFIKDGFDREKDFGLKINKSYAKNEAVEIPVEEGKPIALAAREVTYYEAKTWTYAESLADENDPETPENPDPPVSSNPLDGTWTSAVKDCDGNHQILEFNGNTFSFKDYRADGSLEESVSGTFVIDDSQVPGLMTLTVEAVDVDDGHTSVGHKTYGIYQYEEGTVSLTFEDGPDGVLSERPDFFTGQKQVLISDDATCSTAPISGSWRGIHPGDGERLITATFACGYAEIITTDLNGNIIDGVRGVPTFTASGNVDIRVTYVYGDSVGRVAVGDTVYGIYEGNSNNLKFAVGLDSRPADYDFSSYPDGMLGADMGTVCEIRYFGEFDEDNKGAIVGVKEEEGLGFTFNNNSIYCSDAFIENGSSVELNIDGYKVNAQATIDPGYQYAAWGEWNASLPLGLPSTGYWVAGKSPDYDVIYARTGSAHYDGKVIGDYAKAPGTIIHGAITGDINLVADFDHDTVSGVMSLLYDGNPYAAPYFDDASINRETNYDNQDVPSFNAELVDGAGGHGQIKGDFYGPYAEEVGGNFQYFHQDGSKAVGIYRAKEL